jgi:hypothetical protein
MSILLQPIWRERDDTAARLVELEPFQKGAEQALGFMAQTNLRRVDHFLVESTEPEAARYHGATTALEIAKTLIYAMEAYRQNTHT